MRAWKWRNVCSAIFGVSDQLVFFASTGRGKVARRYARTTLPEMPSVRARSSGRVILRTFAGTLRAFAMSVTPFRAFAVMPRILAYGHTMSRVVLQTLYIRSYASMVVCVWVWTRMRMLDDAYARTPPCHPCAARARGGQNCAERSEPDLVFQ